jgi:hypothetical protein
VKKKNQPATELLVQWSNTADEDTTWEDYTEPSKQFSNFCLEDKTFENGALSELEIINRLGAVGAEFDLIIYAEEELKALAVIEMGWHINKESAQCILSCNPVTGEEK